MNISKITARYISQRPSVRDCLARGLVNHSALAREICATLRIEEFDAALAATRRYAARLRARTQPDAKVHELLQKTRLRVRNRMTVATSATPRLTGELKELQQQVISERGDFSIIQGEDTVTLITNDEYAKLLKSICGQSLIQLKSRLVQVTLLFDERIETTRGVLAHLFGLLAEAQVNVLEEMSCWTDVMLIISEADLTKTLEALDLQAGRDSL